MEIKRTGEIFKIVMWIGLSFLVGCGSLPEKTSTYIQLEPVQKTDKVSVSNADSVKQKLYKQYSKWQGVRHKLGGVSRNGIDCSGFVQLTFKKKLGIDLPRTTRLQSSLGKEIRKSDLKAGDLVFFRTGSTSRHVGIYLEKNKFLHVSERRGVIISKLDNVYWKSNYWKSIRI